MGASGAARSVAVAVEAMRRGKESLLSEVVVDDLRAEEKIHPDVSVVIVGGRGASHGTELARSELDAGKSIASLYQASL